MDMLCHSLESLPSWRRTLDMTQAFGALHAGDAVLNVKYGALLTRSAAFGGTSGRPVELVRHTSCSAGHGPNVATQ